MVEFIDLGDDPDGDLSEIEGIAAGIISGRISAVKIELGDPRYCQQPVRHPPHTHRYEYDRASGERTHGSYDCDGAPWPAPPFDAPDIRWWHAYGGLVSLTEDKPPGGWMRVTPGPVDFGPDGTWANGAAVPDPLDAGEKWGKLPYLGSWTHEPTAAELAAKIPPIVHDDDCDCGADHKSDFKPPPNVRRCLTCEAPVFVARSVDNAIMILDIRPVDGGELQLYGFNIADQPTAVYGGEGVDLTGQRLRNQATYSRHTCGDREETIEEIAADYERLVDEYLDRVVTPEEVERRLQAFLAGTQDEQGDDHG